MVCLTNKVKRALVISLMLSMSLSLFALQINIANSQPSGSSDERIAELKFQLHLKERELEAVNELLPPKGKVIILDWNSLRLPQRRGEVRSLIKHIDKDALVQLFFEATSELNPRFKQGILDNALLKTHRELTKVFLQQKNEINSDINAIKYELKQLSNSRKSSSQLFGNATEGLSTFEEYLRNEQETSPSTYDWKITGTWVYQDKAPAWPHLAKTKAMLNVDSYKKSDRPRISLKIENMYGAPGWTANAEFIPVNFDVYESRTDTVYVNGEFHGPQRYLSPAKENISKNKIINISCPMTREPGGIGRLQVYNAGRHDEYLELEVEFNQCTQGAPGRIGFRMTRR